MQNNKGASSVLVILILVVLVALGLAALTTSLAAMRLGDRSGDWYGTFYILDGQAEKNIAVIDKLILEADLYARSYLDDPKDMELSDELKYAIESETDKNKIYRMIFLYRLRELIGSSDIMLVQNGFTQDLSKVISEEKIPVIRFTVSQNNRLDAAVEIYNQEDGYRYRIIEWIHGSD